ncbi:hypothetical protein HK096_005804, partial [Nowakowskiella sp. JEL0078]
VHGYSDLLTVQKEATKEAIKMAKEALSKANPMEIKQKRKALTKNIKEYKEEESSNGKKSGRVRQAPKRLVDEGSDEDFEEDVKKHIKTKKKSEEDEEDFSPNGKSKKGLRRKVTKKSEVCKEEEESQESTSEHDDNPKGRSKKLTSAPKAGKNILGTTKGFEEMKEIINKVMNDEPSIHLKPAYPSDEQIKILANMNIASLKHLLRRVDICDYLSLN